MIAVTGATGKLGRHVVKALLRQVPAAQIVAVVRNLEKAADLAALGVTLRQADYTEPSTLTAAFAGVEKVLLISSNEVGVRVPQHRAVIDACVAASVKLLAYTSLLRASTSTLALASDHVATETMILNSGLAYVLLRNGWYLENHTEALGPALQHGVILGAAQEGRFAAAAREDYAAAAVAVLTGEGHQNKVYELAGDAAYTLPELAATVSSVSQVAVAYRNMSKQEYQAALVGFGLPPEVAGILADADAGAAKGELDGEGKDLRLLCGRPSTTLAEAVRRAVAA